MNFTTTAPDRKTLVKVIGCPLNEMTVLSLTNLIHMLYSERYILAKSVREECIKGAYYDNRCLRVG